MVKYYFKYLICKLLNRLYFYRCGVQPVCVCSQEFLSQDVKCLNQQVIQTPVRENTSPIIPREVPQKPKKNSRKRRIIEVSGDETFPASYPDEANSNFNDGKIQNDLNYSFTRSGAKRGPQDKASVDKQSFQQTSTDSNADVYFPNPETFNILSIFDDELSNVNLYCNEDLKLD